MALHAEPPSSKVKREQALRNILAARRRQLLGPRPGSEIPKSEPSLWSKTPRSSTAVSKDNADMLEAQETRQGVYVTAPIGDEIAIILNNEEDDSPNRRSSQSPDSIPSRRTQEESEGSTKSSLLIRIKEDTSDKSSKNASQSSSRSQKQSEPPDSRRKNTVAMPESLYNHFRPVESNIPVEDMTQFLYFGQKIQPEVGTSSTTASSSGNNSILDTTSSSSVSRRRYSSMKRFSTTTPVPVPRLEEIINEEMNIALERSTIERNKIPKTKTVFRAPGTGTYFRKPPSKSTSGDQTIVSNVIPTRESVRNGSGDSEAADRVNQVTMGGLGEERGYVGDEVEVRNATAVGGRTKLVAVDRSEDSGDDEGSGSRRVDGKGGRTVFREDPEQHQQNQQNQQQHQSLQVTRRIDQDFGSEASITTQSPTTKFTTATTATSVPTDEKNKLTGWPFLTKDLKVSPSTFSAKTTSSDPETLTTSAINDPSAVTESASPRTTENLARSSLRIVVTEPVVGYESTAGGWESAEARSGDEAGGGTSRGKVYQLPSGGTVNQEPDSRKDRAPLARGASGLPSSRESGPREKESGGGNESESRTPSAKPSRFGLQNPQASTTRPVAAPAEERDGTPLLENSTSSPSTSSIGSGKTEHKQQQAHAYAYEITNVTRLLRNYTGAGLSGVGEKKERKESEEEQQLQEEEEEEEEKRKRLGSSKKTSGKRKLVVVEEEEEERGGEEEEEAEMEWKREKDVDRNNGKRRKKKKKEEEEDEEEGAALTRGRSEGSSAPEIRNDGRSSEQPTPHQRQQQSPLPLLLLPTLLEGASSGGTVEPAARKPPVLSAGTDVDEATGSTGSKSTTRNAITRSGGAPVTRSSASSNSGTGASGDGGSGGGGGGGVVGARPTRTDTDSRSSDSPAFSSSSSSSYSSSASSSSSSSYTSSSSSSSSSSALVGERGRKGGLGSARPQYHQQNQNRASAGRAASLPVGGPGDSPRNTWHSGAAATEVTPTSGQGTHPRIDETNDSDIDVEANNDTHRSDSRTNDRAAKEAKSVIDEVTENTLVTSTLRWNHTGVKRLAGETRQRESHGNDRRHLRKSASAVLNQRTIEEGIARDIKRRREHAVHSHDSSSSPSQPSLERRLKQRVNDKLDEPTTTTTTNPLSPTMEDSATSRLNDTDARSTAQYRASNSTLPTTETPNDKIADGMTEHRRKAQPDSGDAIENNHPNETTPLPEDANPVTNDPTHSHEDILDSNQKFSHEIGAQGQGQSDRSSNLTQPVLVLPNPGGYPSAENNESDADKRDHLGHPLNSTTDTPIPNDTSSHHNSESVLTTSAPPVFPVTPRMLQDPEQPNEAPEEESRQPEQPPKDVPPNENLPSDDQTKPVNNLEPGRPFGLAKDLDPSEIQKMYRSQTTIRPDLPATTIIPGSPIDPDQVTELTSTSKSRDTPEIPIDSSESPSNSSSTRRPLANERSPEVRARNLSDKIKDKDDVLPIMQLYNTSDIFNGTSGGDSRKEAAPRPSAGVALPARGIEVNATSSDEGPPRLVPEVASESNQAGRRKGEETERRTGVRRQPGDDSDAQLEAGGDTSLKNQRTGAGRDHEPRVENSTSASGRWSNHSGHTFSQSNNNRTRIHRPTSYYHSPEFVGYRPEFNGSFFEPGMISVGSRDSVNVSEVITKRHDGDTIATQETVAVVSYILATLIVFPIAVGVGLILRRLIIRNRKVLEESDTSSEISCRKDALNLENGDFKTSIEKAITKLPRIQHLCHEAEKPPPPPTQESRWEFPRDKLRLQTVLGQGNFGQVWKAEADDLTGHQGTTRLVAVKTVKEGASAREKEDLIRELEIMQQLGNHSNVVTLLGCCTEEEPHYLILEYVMYGKLLAYLRDHRTRQDFYNFSEDSAALTSRDLTVFGYCVARGMEYLASKKIIHRDLAARNVLVDHNKLCKIADFGMSRFANEEGEVIEARHGRNALPIRWMAPESLIYSLFTTKTDVWSFGILMWEIVTLGSTPYPDMAAREVMRNVQNGYRLERPSHCRSELFRVIARCWHADPDRRPEFQTLRRDMAQLLEDSMNGHYVDLESFASECTD